MVPRLLVAALAVAVALVLALPASAQQVDRRGVSPKAPNPLVGEKWFVDPQEPAYGTYRSYLRQGRRADAALIGKIALTPRFKWFGRFSRPTVGSIRSFIKRAKAAGAVPLVATLRHQGRQCNPRYQAGGRREDRATKRWFKAFARGHRQVPRDHRLRARLDRHHRVPGPQPPQGQGRGAALRRRACSSKLPNATVYIEATASDWKSVGLRRPDAAADRSVRRCAGSC